MCITNVYMVTAGPRVWNALSQELRQDTSFRQFRRKLKSHLFVYVVTDCFLVPYKYSYLLSYLLEPTGPPPQKKMASQLVQTSWLVRKLKLTHTEAGSHQ